MSKLKVARKGDHLVFGFEDGPTTAQVRILETELQALREFFQAEADERLGRWRHPDYPHIYVKPWNGRPELVGVVKDNEKGLAYGQFTRGQEPRLDPMTIVAHAYFNAHPEPKPEWHGAREGEVWILKTERGFTLPMICQADAFRDHAGMFPLDSGEILEARRIWSPEGES